LSPNQTTYHNGRPADKRGQSGGIRRELKPGRRLAAQVAASDTTGRPAGRLQSPRPADERRRFLFARARSPANYYLRPSARSTAEEAQSSAEGLMSTISAFAYLL